MSQLRKKVILTRSRGVILIFAAFGLGFVIATGIAQMLEKPKTSTEIVNPDDMREVFVAKKDIRNGSELRPEDFIVAHYSKETVPKGAVKTFQQIEGRTTKVLLPKGTILIDDYFVSRTAKSGDPGFIPPGFSSVPVQVYEPSLAQSDDNYAMSPGDRVDVVITQINEETGEVFEEFVLLKEVTVLETNWAEESDHIEKKGEVNLLLSDIQKKDLHAELNENTIIRLRICPTEPSQTAGESLLQKNSAPTTQPSPLMEMVSSEQQITVVFGDKNRRMDEKNTTTQASGKVLRLADPSELQVATLRGIPEESYTREYTVASQKSILDNSRSPNKLSTVKPGPRYTSFYDSYGQQNQTEMRWQVVVPRSPVVFEAQDRTSPTQPRGVYRQGGVYVSAE